MTISLREPAAADLGAVHALNQAAVPHVNRLPVEALDWFRSHAFYFRVAEVDGRLRGFLIALTPEADYASPNFNWFVRRRTSFVYVDRIVVAPEARRRGLASRLYQDLERVARERAATLTCEVNLHPPNEDSLRFHARRGFVEVGRQLTEGGAKEVCLMEKPLLGGESSRGARRP